MNEPHKRLEYRVRNIFSMKSEFSWPPTIVTGLDGSNECDLEIIIWQVTYLITA